MKFSCSIIIFVISLLSLSCERGGIYVLESENTILRAQNDSLREVISHLRLIISPFDSLRSYKYYIIGSERDLMDKGVIVRVGGLSREKKLSLYHPKALFEFEHIDNIDTLEVYGKRVRLVGNYNPSSYIITGEDRDDYHLFIITDKHLFWRDNLYLIITFM